MRKKDHIFTEEINKIALSLNDDKTMQSIDPIGPNAYGTSKDLVSEVVTIKQNNTKTINFDEVTKENIIQIGQKFLIIYIQY